VLGLPFLRQRKSSFIHGAADDARAMTLQIGAVEIECRGRQQIGSLP